ncbi:MAG: type II toxin-antitoxin system VapC family toxin [Planctomycetota bacterium]
MGLAMVDSSVLLDIMTRDPNWFAWSAETLEEACETHEICLNPVIYAEVSTNFARIEDLEEALQAFERRPIPYEAAFLAAKCFRTYRRRSGKRSGVLPDFFIGAHAAVEDMLLITRDRARFRTCFPKLRIKHPG